MNKIQACVCGLAVLVLTACSGGYSEEKAGELVGRFALEGPGEGLFDEMIDLYGRLGECSIDVCRRCANRADNWAEFYQSVEENSKRYANGDSLSRILQFHRHEMTDAQRERKQAIDTRVKNHIKQTELELNARLEKCSCHR
jgi:hypothetical protein